MKTELYPTHYIYRVGDQAIASIHRYGDKGIIYGMLGKTLLHSLVDDMVSGLLKKEGIRTLEGYVSKRLARGMRIMVRRINGIHVEFGDECEADGRDVVWVIITEHTDAMRID